MGFLLVFLKETLLDLCLHFYRLLYRCLRDSLSLRLVTGDGTLQDVRGLVCGRGVFQETERLVGDSKF